jgi:hypothetical protein
VNPIALAKTVNRPSARADSIFLRHLQNSRLLNFTWPTLLTWLLFYLVSCTPFCISCYGSVYIVTWMARALLSNGSVNKAQQ